jgi:hypothetical protein
MIMKTIVSALLALSVLAGVAAISADYPKFGTSAWWNQQEAEHN